MTKTPLNLILQGPPGTGKTYRTIDEALLILDPAFMAEQPQSPFASQVLEQQARKAIKKRFDLLHEEGRVRLVTFHQSFSYEDFVEGLRAETSEDDGAPRYVIEPGVFRQICEQAQQRIAKGEEVGVGANPRIWKISIDGTGASSTRDHCMRHGEARIGWSHVGDLRNAQLSDPSFNLGSNDRSTLAMFANEIAPGDVMLCIASATSVGAIGVVTGEYRFEPQSPPGVRRDYQNVLPVRWLTSGQNLDILALNAGKRFTQKTVYDIERFTWPELLAVVEAAGILLAGLSGRAGHAADDAPHVLIIDEINRGNVSRIFGELITLIEPSKRLGAPESLQLTLPYSKKRFGVPGNLHIIGTMNTADRSLTGLDIALRRRFAFRDIPPDPMLLNGVLVDDVPMDRLLRVLNQRVEALLDRDHCIGHTYLLPLRNEAAGDKLARLGTVFRESILPLLHEYFFDDIERIGWVLNDPNAPPGVERFFVSTGQEAPMEKLFGRELAERLQDHRWTFNPRALQSIESYRNILRIND
ncbi:MAG: AAA family ATPase [Pseudomonadota bacterium]